jgi:predicted transcriptional regulator
VVGHADETVSRLADRVAAEDVGRVPVVERDTMRLVGLVSRKDLLRIRRTARAAEESVPPISGHRAMSPSRAISAC